MSLADVTLLSRATRDDELWRADAACAHDGPSAFFAVDEDPRRGARGRGELTSPTARAKALCASCPVVTACLAHALRTPETHGIWGGTTPAERESILLGLAG